MFKRNKRAGTGVVINAAAVNVPSTFMIENANYWPVMSASLPSNDPCYPLVDPQFPYAVVRTLTVSIGKLTWAETELTANTYTWTNWDAFFNSPQMGGKLALVTGWLTATPWITSGAPNHYENYYSTYGSPGNLMGCSGPPNSATATYNYVSAVLNRYGSKIFAWETGNEAAFGQLGNNQSFIGTYQEFVDKIAVPTWQAVQDYNTANGSHIVVLAPAMYGNNNSAAMLAYFATVETGGTGRRAIDLCDKLSLHFYNIRTIVSQRDVLNDGGVGLLAQIAPMQAGFGTSKGIIVTEGGFASGSADPALVAWLAGDPTVRARWYEQFVAELALRGVEAVGNYAYDNQLSGNWVKDPYLIASKQKVAAALPGKTIAAGATRNPMTGSISLVSNGVPYTFG